MLRAYLAASEHAMRPNKPSIPAYDVTRMHTIPLPVALYHGLLGSSRAECLVALVVVRATLGWRAQGLPGHRRAQACLSHQELKRLTGIQSSTTISRAIDGLVRGGLLETLTLDGDILATPAARRHYHRPVTFRIPRPVAEPPQ